MPGKTQKKIKPADLYVSAVRILHWFFAYPTHDINLSELCKNTQTAKKTATAVIEGYLQTGFLKRTVLGRSWRLVANLESPLFRREKIAANLTYIYESGIVDEVIRAFPAARSIVLFGSFRKGEDMETSDLDIAVELSGKQKVEIVKFGTLARIGYRTNIAVNVLLFSRSTVDINLFANIANGIVLEGFLEARP